MVAVCDAVQVSDTTMPPLNMLPVHQLLYTLGSI